MRLAFKELLHNKKKYSLITVIVILMMFMVLFLSGLVDGLGRAVSAGIEKMPVTAFAISDDAEGLITISALEDEQYEEIQKQTDGRAATIDIMRMYLMKTDSEEKLDVVYFSIDPEGALAPEVIEGNTFAESDAEYPLLLDDDFKAEGIEVGDTVLDSSTGMEFTVAGFVEDAMYGHVSVAYIPSDDYTELMTAVNPEYKQYYHATALLEGDEDIEVDGVIIFTKDEVINELPGYMSEQMTIKMVDWMLVVITAVILAVFFLVINLQKEKEFGVMKAIGVSMGRLTRFILAEVVLIALCGAVIAAILVIAMAAGLPGTMPFYLQARNVIVILGAFVLISMAGSLLSIIRVSKIDPAAIIGGDN